MNAEMVIKRKSLSDLHGAEYNPRTIRPEALESLGVSMSRFGMMVPIVWNERTGNVVGGHQRLNRLVESGETETDVVVVDLDHNEEVALNITLNNPKIRGRFTKDVVEALERTKEYMGDAFAEIGLKDLLDFMGKLKFDAPEPKSSKPVDHTGDGGGEGGGAQKVLVVCPRCRGKFTLEGRKIVNAGEAAE